MDKDSAARIELGRSFQQEEHFMLKSIKVIFRWHLSLFVPFSRWTSTSWSSLRPVSGCISAQNWPTAAAGFSTPFPRASGWASACIRSKWWSGTSEIDLYSAQKSLYFHQLNDILCVWRGDHTSADSYLTVLPRGTEFVVFSIDGSFAASVSIMGSDPKVRAGAVDVVRWGLFFMNV